jgi:hypothetical protein
MKTQLKSIMIATATLALAGVALQAQSSDAPGHRGGPRPESAEMKANRAEILKKYDANGNGRLDPEERAAFRQDVEDGKIQPPPGPGPHRGGPPRELVEKYDANHNGILDPEEREALHNDIASGKVQPPAGPHRGGPPPELVKKYDANHDGVLDAEERAALRQDIEDGKIEPPHRPGQRPHGPPSPENGDRRAEMLK